MEHGYLDAVALDKLEAVEDDGTTLDAAARAGARRVRLAALEEEVAAYMEANGVARDAGGRRLVVRNGVAQAWGIYLLTRTLTDLPS